jgi:predicted RNA binding protein YcfA (HicA-like mRNA interferase family)
LPRDVAGTELASLLAAYGYRQSRQSGSHMRLVSALRALNITSPFLPMEHCE